MLDQSTPGEVAGQIGPASMPAVTRILSRFERQQLQGFIEVAIELLDVIDGDEDVEMNGDELDGTGAEDDFMDHEPNGPGCPVADRAEYSYPEWHSRGRRKEPLGPRLSHEDEEDDDQDCGQDEGEPDYRPRPWLTDGPGCMISDPDKGAEEDGEIESWSHWLDHPPELHIGKRRGHSDGPEAP